MRSNAGSDVQHIPVRAVRPDAGVPPAQRPRQRRRLATPQHLVPAAVSGAASRQQMALQLAARRQQRCQGPSRRRRRQDPNAAATVAARTAAAPAACRMNSPAPRPPNAAAQQEQLCRRRTGPGITMQIAAASAGCGRDIYLIVAWPLGPPSGRFAHHSSGMSSAIGSAPAGSSFPTT